LSNEEKMLRTNVYDQLRERLLNGDIRAGQFVSQRELTELLGATMNPVREAIRKLEVEGLINVYAQRGIQIIEAGPKAINDAYDFRLLLESEAIRYFARNADKGEVKAAEAKVMQTLAELEASPSSRQIHMRALDDDYEFHKRIVDFQRNEIFSRYYSLNAARLRLFRINLGEPLARLDTAAREHLEILNACAASDPELAGNLLEKHIEISREHTLGVRPMRR
jgi:DNA-binding GntR family transcriptional regulator